MNETLYKKSIITTRDYNRDDKNLILATWLKGLYNGNDWFSEIDKQIYNQNYIRIIERLLMKSQVKISCLKNDQDVVLGYSVYEPNTLHYLYVKPSWRKIGIAKDLLPEDLKVVTHLTSVGRSLLKEKLPDVVFNPFLI